MDEIVISENKTNDERSNKMKHKLNKSQKIQCNSIIHAASVAAGTAGAAGAQIPVADTAVITPIQVAMIISLGSVFGVDVTEGMAKGIISSCAMAFAGRGLSQLVIGWIPGLGNIVNMSTAAGLTEAIGWLSVKHFNEERDKTVWKKEGYVEASQMFNVKFKKQAEEFLKGKQILENDIKEFNNLLDAYEREIERLNRVLKCAQEEITFLKKQSLSEIEERELQNKIIKLENGKVWIKELMQKKEQLEQLPKISK